MADRKGKFKVKNGSGSYDQVMLETTLGQVVDSPIKSLERETRYELNDIAADQTCKGAFLVCTTAGTTAASVPAEYKNAAEGTVVTDGTAVFTVHRFERISSADDLSAHNTSGESHQDIRKKITTDISTHNSDASAHSEFDFVKAISAASDGLHYQMRSGESEQVLDLINQLQTTLSQGTVPSSNTGTLFSLLSGIIHQIAALSGKTNWYDAPKNNFETLSAGVVAGDVSNPNSWWVKLGGTIPLIIQGILVQGSGGSVSFPISFSKTLSFTWGLNEITEEPRICGVYNLTNTGFNYTQRRQNSNGADPISQKSFCVFWGL